MSREARSALYVPEASLWFSSAWQEEVGIAHCLPGKTNRSLNDFSFLCISAYSFRLWSDLESLAPRSNFSAPCNSSTLYFPLSRPVKDGTQHERQTRNRKEDSQESMVVTLSVWAIFHSLKNADEKNTHINCGKVLGGEASVGKVRGWTGRVEHILERKKLGEFRAR